MFIIIWFITRTHFYLNSASIFHFYLRIIQHPIKKILWNIVVIAWKSKKKKEDLSVLYRIFVACMVYPSGQSRITTTENLGICTLPVNQSRDRITLGHCGKEIYHIKHGFRPQRIMLPEVRLQNTSDQLLEIFYWQYLWMSDFF